MSNTTRKCPYCNEEFDKKEIDVHIEIKHYEKHQSIKKRVKIGLAFAVVGISIVIGMIWGNLF